MTDPATIIPALPEPSAMTDLSDLERAGTGLPRLYLPSTYVDEWCPPFRPFPSDWIIRGDLGWHLVACPDYMEDGGDRLGDALADGQVVKFEWSERWPDCTIIVRISEDGEIKHEPIGFIPASINMFWLDGDSDTMNDTLQECLENYHDMAPFADGQELDLSMAEWGDASFKLVMDRDTARFVVLATTGDRA